jgi:hypothetical protein
MMNTHGQADKATPTTAEAECESREGAVPSGPWRKWQDFNPYSVQRHGPGNLSYLFRSKGQKAWLKQILEKSAWRVELVGGHGVGKSTLLRTLRAWTEDSGRPTLWLRCSSEMRTLPRLFWRDLPPRGGVVFLDGGERCSWWQLWLLAQLTQWGGNGLVLTTHRPLGVGRPVRMEVSTVQLQRIVGHLLESSSEKEERGRIEGLLAEYQGNAREVLLRLYDEWEDHGHGRE